MSEPIVVVTRHKVIGEYLKREGIVPQDTPVISRVRPDDVRGRHVFGCVPVWLAAFATKVTEYIVSGSEDSILSMKVEDVPRYLHTPITYVVTREG